MGRKYVGWLPFHSEGVKFDEVGWKTLGYDHIVSLLIVVCIILYPIRPHFLPFQTSLKIIEVFATPRESKVLIIVKHGCNNRINLFEIK